MRDFTTADLSRMQSTQQAAMQDTCKIAVRVATVNVLGEPVYTWPVYGSAIDCGLNMRGGRERERQDGTILITDGLLRLPIATTVNVTDRIQITHRFGVAISPTLVFDVVGEPMRGPSGLQVELKSVL
jgi:hypothetical protein